MKKNTQIIVGVIAVVAVGVAAYVAAGGDLFQGRLSYFGKSKGPSRTSYIASIPLCLTPEEYARKYPPIPSTPGTTPPEADQHGRPVYGTPGTPGVGGGRDTGTDSTATTPARGDSTDTSSKGTPITINPVTGTGTSSTGNTVAKGGTGSGTYSEPAGKGQTPDGKGSTIDPDFVCPDGTITDYQALHDLCKAKKQKNCYAAGKPDNSSKADAMCKALEIEYTGECPNDDQCKQYAAWAKAKVLTANLTKNGKTWNDFLVCRYLGK